METTLEEWELNYAVLARGYFLAAREAFKVLAAQGRGGSLVFVGSKNALVGGANAADESVAKSGISITVFGKRGVTVEMPRTRTGAFVPCVRAYSIDDTTIAAPPSDVAQMSRRWRGDATIGEASTSSSVTALR